MTIKDIFTIKDGPSGLTLKKNKENLNNSSKFSEIVLIQDNNIKSENISIKEKDLNRSIINIKNQAFILINKLGKDAGKTIFINENHSFNTIISSNQTMIIYMEKKYDYFKLYNLYLYLEYLYNTEKINSKLNLNGYVKMLSIKDLKNMNLDKKIIELNNSEINQIENLIINKNLLLQKEIELFSYIKQMILNGLLVNEEKELKILNKKEILLPKSWVISKTKSILEFKSGKVFDSSILNSSKGIRTLTITDFVDTGYSKDEKFIDIDIEELEKIKLKKQYKFKEDIIIALSHHMGLVIKNEIEGIFNNHLFKVFSNNTKLSNDFLYYLLKDKNIQSGIKRLSTESTFSNSYDSRYLLDIFIPSIKEQKEIVLLLEMFDSKINEEKVLISKYLLLKSTLFHKKIKNL